jgi:CBS domain-containing protein
MELSKIANTRPVLATADLSVFEGVKLMASREGDALVITGSDNRVQGIFTEHDNLMRVTLQERNPRTTALTSVMTSPVIVARPESTVDEALALMVRHHFRHLPLVNAQQQIVAIVSARNLLMRRIGEKEAALQTLEAYVSAGGPG